MSDRIKEIARQLGAEVVTELPDVGGGALGAAQYAAFFSRRLEELRQPEFADSDKLQVPVEEATLHALVFIAETLWPDREVDAAVLAAGLLKGITFLVLDQVKQQSDSPKNSTKAKADVRAAVLAAFQEALDHLPERQKAG